MIRRTQNKKRYTLHGFTLVELLIAMSILGIITTLVSGMFIDTFKQSRRIALQNSVYEDTRYVMNQLVQEIQQSRIDYDEYYNQNVVIPAHPAGSNNAPTYGQNFGFYYSAFFNPGDDAKLGYTCNDDQDHNGQLDRNRPGCTPIRGTLDSHTGQNPYSGKFNPDDVSRETAFCVNNCGLDGNSLSQITGDLYLISADGSQKTIIARERIGGTNAVPLWAIARVRMSGSDTTNDGVIDSFSCTDGYDCGGTLECPSGSGVAEELPGKLDDLNPGDASFNTACDGLVNGFSHDFVPISPLRIDVSDLKFQITPVEDPDYAFGESFMQRQPQVTITMTVRPNPEMVADKDAFEPFTIVRTVTAGRGERIQAPIHVQ